MGDRTTVCIEVLASTRQSVEDALGQEADDDYEGETPGTVHLTFFEVQGGGFDLLLALARSGIVFRGSHGDGCDYHGMTFAAADGTFAETPSPQGDLMVGFDPETGEASARDLAAARHWRRIDDQVIAYFASRWHLSAHRTHPVPIIPEAPQPPDGRPEPADKEGGRRAKEGASSLCRPA